MSIKNPIAFIGQKILGGTNGSFLAVDSNIAITQRTAAQTASDIQASVDHGSIAGLGDDDHTQYALLLGRSGGQTIIGGTASGNNLTLRSTSNATRGKIIFGNAGTTAYDEVNERFGITTASPTNTLSFSGNAARKVWLERHSTANTAGNTLTVEAGGATSAATDKAGGTLILSGGVSTGTGGSQIDFYTAPTGSTGTSDNAVTRKAILDNKGQFQIYPTAVGEGIYIENSSSSTVGPFVQTYHTATGAANNIPFGYRHDWKNASGTQKVMAYQRYRGTVATSGSEATQWELVLQHGTNNADQQILTVASSGLATLEKSNSGALGPELRLNNSAGAASDKEALTFYSGGSARAMIRSTVEASPYYGSIEFHTGLTTLTEVARITGAGYLGIGTSSPARYLDIVKTVSSGNLMKIDYTLDTPNTGDSADGGLEVNTTISAASATSELVMRCFLMRATNSLTGGGALTNMRCINLATNTSASTTTTNMSHLYLETGTTSGTVTNGYGLYVGSVQGTNKWGIYDSCAGRWEATNGSVVIGNGSQPTGGDKGAGTINAKAVYDDNVLLTDDVFDVYHGDEPASKKQIVERDKVHSYPDGLEQKTVTLKQKYWEGTDIEVSEAEWEKYQAGPSEVLELPDLKAFTEQNRHLPTIPGREYWKQNGKPSIGQLTSCIYETIEHHAIYHFKHHDEIQELKRELAALKLKIKS